MKLETTGVLYSATEMKNQIDYFAVKTFDQS